MRCQLHSVDIAANDERNLSEPILNRMDVHTVQRHAEQSFGSAKLAKWAQSVDNGHLAAAKKLVLRLRRVWGERSARALSKKQLGNAS